MTLSLDSKISELLDDEAAKSVLVKHLPDILDHPQLAMAKGFRLPDIVAYSNGMITKEKLDAIEKDLADL